MAVPDLSVPGTARPHARLAHAIAEWEHAAAALAALLQRQSAGEHAAWSALFAAYAAHSLAAQQVATCAQEVAARAAQQAVEAACDGVSAG